MNKEELSMIIDGIDEMNGDECKAFIKGFVMSFNIFCEMQDAEDAINEMEERIKELEEENKKLINKKLSANYSSIYDERQSGKYDYRHVIRLEFDNLDTAVEVINDATNLMDKAGHISIKDLYSIVGLPTNNAMNYYVWNTMNATRIEVTGRNYTLLMPVPMRIPTE